MKENDESKEQSSRVSTCFEGSPCVEMMQKIMGEQGTGSLCDEMMRTWAERCRQGQEGPREAPKKEDHGKENSNGGVK